VSSLTVTCIRKHCQWQFYVVDLLVHSHCSRVAAALQWFGSAFSSAAACPDWPRLYHSLEWSTPVYNVRDSWPLVTLETQRELTTVLELVDVDVGRQFNSADLSTNSTTCHVWRWRHATCQHQTHDWSAGRQLQRSCL